MPPQMIRLGLVTFALLAAVPLARAMDMPVLTDNVLTDNVLTESVLTESVANAMAQASPEAMAEYRRKLKEYEEARAPIDAYWNSIAEKRRGRNAKRRAGQQVTLDDYVLTQPPVYRGPPRPIDPSAPEVERVRKPLPMVPD